VEIFPVYRNAVNVDGKVIFISRRPSSVSIQVDKRNDAMAAAVFVVRIDGIQKEPCNNSFRQILFHGKPVIKKTNGIMPGGGTEERENGQIVFESEAVSMYES